MVKHSFKKFHIALLLALFGISGLTGCSGTQTNGSAGTSSGAADNPDARGQDIIAEYLKRDTAPYRKIRVRFTIRTEGEPEKIYELDTSRRQTADATSTMTQIVKPAEDSDLGSLTLEQKGQKAVVVTYAASRDEFRETDTKKIFFGGLTAGELLGEWDKFNFKQTGEKLLDGQKVFELEGKLKPDASSVGSRMTVLVREDTYIPVELHLFDSSGREIRNVKASDFKSDAGGAYPAKTEVDNPVYKANIVIEILSREFPPNIDDSMFSREKLKQFMRK